MSVQRLTERVSAPFTGSRVNREAGTIDGVLICGFESANGNDYPEAVFRRDFAVYEGAMVNCDHGREATVDRRFGWFTGVKPGTDGKPRGTLNCLKSHPMFGRVMEAAERNPALYGFSHVAQCETARHNGRNRVEAIKVCESIDLVAQPATTKGLFESKGGAVATISLKKFVERFGPKWGAKKWAAATKLCEDIGDTADAPVMDEPAADATEGDLKSALMAAITPMLDEAFESGDAAKVCAALKDFIKLHSKHTGKAEPKDGPPADDDAAEESKKRPTLAGLLAEAKAAGIAKPTLEDAAAVEGIPTAAGRKVVFERFAATAKLTEAETPRSSGKQPGSGPAPGQKKTGPDGKAITESVPTDAKAFAASIRE